MSASIKSKRAYSLRRRLLTGMIAGFFCILAGISVLLWTYARNAANQTYDLLLAGSALSILERITGTPEGFNVDIPFSALEIVGLAENDRIFYRVFDQTRNTLTGTNNLPLPENYTPSAEPRYFDARYDGEDFRFIIQGRLLLHRDAPSWVLVQLGQTRLARDSLQLDLITKGLSGLIGLAIVGLLFVWFAINRALRPLAGIEAGLRNREPTDLTPLRASPPREVESLIGSINDFMRRLETSKEHAQGFIADVAHQMRTSLAALHGQLALAADQKDSESIRIRLEQAEIQAQRTIRLTNQLLSHAMVLHRANNQPRRPVQMTPIIKTVMEEVLREPPGNDIEFEFVSNGLGDDEMTVHGDVIALREAIRNILDNAIKHGPSTNQIDIYLERSKIGATDALRVAVEDAGGGIPEHERENVLKRFYSLNQKNKGSGIGLSIVHAVAESHQGSLELKESRYNGLRVELNIPLEKAKR